MKKPNVILIMTDDQGYGDLGCMGNTDFKTPNIDELADDGIRFTSMYSASPVCSPSRASLLTGRYPANAGVREILRGTRQAPGINAKVPTIATALKGLGYSTGIIGKWHLGLQAQSRPNSNGFDEFSGFLAGCLDYYSHIFYWGMADGASNPTHDLWENENEVWANGEYLTQRITRQSVEFIQNHRDEPFLLYVAYNAPHYPMHAPQEYIDRFPDLPWDRQVMAAMISAVDDGVGEIRAELERQGLLDNTIIYFQSDNGPSRESRNWLDGTPDFYYGGSSGIFKGHKFSLFEGGIRVPAILSMHNHTEKRIDNNAHIAADIFPTVLQACGGNTADYQLDGISLAPMLDNKDAESHEYLFWEMEGQTACRWGKYKLVLNGRLVENEEPVAEVFLSDLSSDPGERYNLADELPDICAEMKEKALEWRKEIEKNWAEKFAANYLG